MLDAYKLFVAWAQIQKGIKIKCFCLDKGGEYTGHAFTKFLKKQGTEHQLTTHDTPQYNSIAESLNYQLVKYIHAFLI